MSGNLIARAAFLSGEERLGGDSQVIVLPILFVVRRGAQMAISRLSSKQDIKVARVEGG